MLGSCRIHKAEGSSTGHRSSFLLDQHESVGLTDSSSLNSTLTKNGSLALLAVTPHSISEGHSA
ncbi:hypothetical protein AQB9606_03649 [Aquabacterium sp. CECT 9606]|nr:hypothetical protein AQB9606_03649 [Aquabacterium sp. CECT 9606]